MALTCHGVMNYPSFKLIIVGDGETGKTTFVKRHLTGGFGSAYEPTVGVEVSPLDFRTNYGPMRFYCWDSARPQIHSDRYFDGAQCAIIMFDVTARSTYENVRHWHEIVCRKCGSIPIVLCGNKVDVKTREVKAKQVAKTSLQYYEISAKSNYNFEKPFVYLFRELAEDHKLHLVRSPALAHPEVQIDMEAQEKFEQELAAAGDDGDDDAITA